MDDTGSKILKGSVLACYRMFSAFTIQFWIKTKLLRPHNAWHWGNKTHRAANMSKVLMLSTLDRFPEYGGNRLIWICQTSAHRKSSVHYEIKEIMFTQNELAGSSVLLHREKHYIIIWSGVLAYNCVFIMCHQFTEADIYTYVKSKGAGTALWSKYK